jgi:hypothetical protein
VDLLIEGDGDLQVYEIKSSSTPKADFFENINLFAAMSAAAGIKSKKHLIYTGSDSYLIDKIKVVSWLDPA